MLKRRVEKGEETGEEVLGLVRLPAMVVDSSCQKLPWLASTAAGRQMGPGDQPALQLTKGTRTRTVMLTQGSCILHTRKDEGESFVTCLNLNDIDWATARWIIYIKVKCIHHITSW